VTKSLRLDELSRPVRAYDPPDGRPSGLRRRGGGFGVAEGRDHFLRKAIEIFELDRAVSTEEKATGNAPRP
jgi:hypothetical protein